MLYSRCFICLEKGKKSVYWHFEAQYYFIIWPELICILFTISISLMFDCFWDFKSFAPVSKISIFCPDFCSFWLVKGFQTEEEMAKCLAKAQMEAELDNALKQLELETRKCINRRLKKSGIDKNIMEIVCQRFWYFPIKTSSPLRLNISSWLIEATVRSILLRMCD